jgi:UDP-glucose 4-epimerase
MKILVTGSAGHLGEALVRTLKRSGHEGIGLDVKSSPYTDCVGSITNREFVRDCVASVDAIIHTATLHKPHVGTHSRQEFVDTNISGTLNLLEEAVLNQIKSFVFTSTTSTFGDAMKPVDGEPAVWVTEDLRPQPKNIYGVTKLAAEDLCRLFSQKAGLSCVVLKTSRFFPEADDDVSKRNGFDDDNLKVNELLFRRADIEDIVSAHLLAIEKAPDIGFERMIVTATTPFAPDDAAVLGTDAPSVLERYVPDYVVEYARRNWRMFPTIGRVYDNSHARKILGWEPAYNFETAIKGICAGVDYKSELAREIGKKGYHDREFEDGPYPINNF